MRHVVEIAPDSPGAWRALGDQLVLTGDSEGADGAYAQQLRASANDPVLREAAVALCEDRLSVAERLLRERLKRSPTDVAAMRMLAELGTRLGRYRDSEALLARCLELSPSFTGARHNLAIVLYRQQKGAEAIGHIERLMAAEPGEPAYRTLLAACLGLVGEYQRSIDVYEALLARHGAQPRVQLAYGHALRAAGRRDDAIAAYHEALRLAPGTGEAYWSLANLKTERFSGAEQAAMAEALARPEATDDDRLHLHYALGKALEDGGDFARSFAHYSEGARLRRAKVPHDAEAVAALAARTRAVFTPELYAGRKDAGFHDPSPIFIVGLPRAGSTLVEQILASHSSVEGTMELPDIITIARDLGHGRKTAASPSYPDIVAGLSSEALAALGETYIARTRIHRKRGRPFFIDKLPHNFQHLGLIRLILPRAKVIDVRRHPMAAGFAVFKQHFARGQTFSCDLGDIGRYYRDYVDVMRHFGEVQPGAVHRVVYEDLVAHTEGEVRALLAYCGLAFEPACLRFYETERPVRTASSEQVRRPIFRDALEHWRNYEPWLGPLKTALGETAQSWR